MPDYQKIYNLERQKIGYLKDFSWLGCKIIVDKQYAKEDIDQIILFYEQDQIEKEIYLKLETVYENKDNPYYNEIECKFEEIDPTDLFEKMLADEEAKSQTKCEVEGSQTTDKRLYQRFELIAEVFDTEDNVIGFLKDISWSGCRVAVNKKISPEKFKHFILYPPNKEFYDKININAEVVWNRDYLPDYNLLGLKFLKIDPRGGFLQLLIHASNKHEDVC